MRTLLALSAALLLPLAVLRPEDEKENKKEAKDNNLLVNGSFEDGPDVEAFLALDKGATDVKGWTVTRGQIDYIGTHWTSGDGKRSLDLHGSPGFGGVRQAFKTIDGARYQVTFLMAGSPGRKQAVCALCVRAAGKKEVFSFDATDTT
ncbi:MAG: DUF642 domain-containing protein, partial [Gemmataceae bacterium]|nr:DUF642 domain-containing protein [Gemmataceae bacterium]